MKLVLLACGPLLAAGLTSPRPATPTPPPAAVPVVVELFTSEGCSSCPAADDVLRTLEATQPVPGAEVIVLGEHVDYWNRLGWKDPFSAAEFSARQRQYASVFKEGNYTPQAVVNGRYELVGSRGAELSQRLAEAARAPQATVTLSQPTAATLAVRVGSLPPAPPQPKSCWPSPKPAWLPKWARARTRGACCTMPPWCGPCAPWVP